MTALLSRRLALGGLMALPAVSLIGSQALAEKSPSRESRLAALERTHPGKICVAILDMATGKTVMHRADDRMLLCSTFKLIAAAYVLKRVEDKAEALDRRVVFSPQDVVQASPGTKDRTGEPGMSMAELCEAAITLSDNTAGNLLLASFGGPAALTGFFRTIGDGISRLDRTETSLNYHDGPDDIRDTTTAAAMLANLQRLVFGDVLSPKSRAQLVSWLINTKTSDARIRAGVPRDCLVGDKTGVNGDTDGNLNDVAILLPTRRAPILVAAYTEIPGIPAADRNAVIAEIGRIALEL